ncbi:MAG: two-component system C4-dicarboxylate transport response regulator DctD [Cellvibrionaceae bacterium]|jgi:two-component system C4-dicarboxylate transport response regulator DctD
MNIRIEKDNIAIIIIDDDEDIRINTADLLSTQFNNIELYSSPAKVIDKISTELPAIILTDLRMPDADGFEFAQKVQEIDPTLPVILMTGYGDISIAVDAIKHGIYDFIEKPFDIDRLIESIRRAIEKRFLTLSLADVQKKLSDNKKIENQLIGYCPAMKQLKRDIIDFAPMDIPVMIYGQTGSGKELAARCLHEYSVRNQHNFVALNCAAIPEQLAEAELFGYKKGAFTDAKNARVGKLEYAKNGTLFLDEVESLSLATQAKLLRALSDNVITPVGCNEEISINCRVISATKEDLRNNENFRQDLFFRLQVAEIKIPPLRDRNEDIIHLFEVFAMQHCERLGTQYRAITPYTKDRLIDYSWPGNVRELLNVTTRYAIKNCSDIDYALESTETFIEMSNEQKSLKELVEYYEASVIKLKLHKYKGKVSKVLDDLSIERRTFNQKLNKYGINTSDFKQNPE